jgi:hypothetical protein
MPPVGGQMVTGTRRVAVSRMPRHSRGFRGPLSAQFGSLVVSSADVGLLSPFAIICINVYPDAMA